MGLDSISLVAVKIDMKSVPNKNGTYEYPCPENIRGSELLS